MSVHTQPPSLATTVSETVVVAVAVDVDVVVTLLTMPGACDVPEVLVASETSLQFLRAR